MRVWKWLGLAGLVGVAATGAAVTRAERARRAYTADDVRTRLHERLVAGADAERLAGPGQVAPNASAGAPGTSTSAT